MVIVANLIVQGLPNERDNPSLYILVLLIAYIINPSHSSFTPQRETEREREGESKTSMTPTNIRFLTKEKACLAYISPSYTNTTLFTSCIALSKGHTECK